MAITLTKKNKGILLNNVKKEKNKSSLEEIFKRYPTDYKMNYKTGEYWLEGEENTMKEAKKQTVGEQFLIALEQVREIQEGKIVPKTWRQIFSELGEE